MKKRINKNKAFTLIELLVVIVVLGIAVLLAVPKFLDNAENAKLVQIQNDAKVSENMIEAEALRNDELTKNWEIVESAIVEEYKNNNSLFNKKGLISSNEMLNDEFLSIPEEFIESDLKGDFLLDAKGGLVYYHEDGVNDGKNEKPESPEEPESPESPENPESPEDEPEVPKQENWEEFYSNELILKSWSTATNSSNSEALRIYNYGTKLWVYAFKDNKDFIDLNIPVDFTKYEYRINVLEADSDYAFNLSYKGANKPVGAINVYPIESNSTRDLFSFTGWGNPNKLNVKYDNRIKFKIERNLLNIEEDPIDTNPEISCYIGSELIEPIKEPKLLGSFKLNVTRDHYISLNGFSIWSNPESPYFKFNYSSYPYGFGTPSIDLLSSIKKDTSEIKAWNYSFQYKNDLYSGGPGDINIYRIYDHIPKIEGTPTVKATSSEKRKITKLEISGVVSDKNSQNTGENENLMLSYDVRNTEVKNKALSCVKIIKQANFSEISHIDGELPIGSHQLILSVKNAKGQVSSKSISFNVEKGDF